MNARGMLAAALAAAMTAGSLLSPGWIAAQEATPEICSEMTDAQSRSLAEEFMAMVAARNLSGLGEIVAPDVTYLSPISGEKRGPEGMAAALGAIFGAYPDVEHVTRGIIADGDTAIVGWSASGTNTGPMAGAPATGEARHWNGIYLFHTACGRIADGMAAVDQESVLGAPGGGAAEIAAPTPDAAAATPEVCEDMSEDALRASVDTLWNDAWNAHDASAYRDLVTPGVIHHWTSGDDTAGADESAARLEAFFAAMPDIRISWNDIAAEGDLAAAAWTLTGTDTGGMFGNPPTGAAIDYDGINIFRFDCGLIAEIWSEGDILRLRQELAGK